jgi:5'-3' exonuclease
MDKVLIAIDGNWLVHRSLSMCAKVPEEARPRVVARQLVSWAYNYAAKVRATHGFVAFDGGDIFRRKIWPLYKANRKTLLVNGQPVSDEERDRLISSGAPIEIQDRPDLYASMTLARETLRSFDFPVLHPTRLEADDALASAAALAERTGDLRHAYLCTRDKDIVGSINEKASQWMPGKADEAPEVVSLANVGDRLARIVGIRAAKWTPRKFREYQVLVGDPTDYIPEIISPGQAVSLLNRINSLGDWLYSASDGIQFCKKHSAAIIRNRELVIMDNTLIPDLAPLRIPKPRTDVERLHAPAALAAMHDYHKLMAINPNRSLFGKR